MPWGAIAGSVISAYGASGGYASSTPKRRQGVYRRAERMARNRWLRRAKPALVTCGSALGLWAGYYALMWVLWWQPHSTALINTVYP
jgi:hypothetical protein